MNKSAVYFFFAITLSLGFSFSLKSQVNDAGLWAGVNIEKKITQAISVEFNHETRFNENISEAGSFINEFGVNYRFDKKSRVSAFYRLNAQRQLNNMYIPVNRFFVDYLYKNTIKSIEVNMRIRTQVQQKNAFLFDSDGNTRCAIRLKLSFKYPIRKFQPYISGEVYIPVFYYEYKPIDKLRCTLGTEYSFNKQHSIDLRYMIQKEFFTENPVTDFVIGVGYSFRF